MTPWIRRMISTAMLAPLALLAACGGGSGFDSDADISALAQRAPELTTLAEAVKATGLSVTLSSPGPYTVLAPTNAAFDSLLTELGLTKDALMADRALLETVLKYHVLPGRIARADIASGKAVEPLGGGFFKIDASNTERIATDGRNRTARLQLTDLAAANGLVHVVDRVLLPANRTLMQTVQADASLGHLAIALAATGLADTLSDAGPFTLLAPTNAAFDALAAELALTPAQLLADVPLLRRVLAYHIVEVRLLRADLPLGQHVTTQLGRAVSFTATAGAGMQVTDECGCSANLLRTDILGANGALHVIDKVLKPAP